MRVRISQVMNLVRPHGDEEKHQGDQENGAQPRITTRLDCDCAASGDVAFLADSTWLIPGDEQEERCRVISDEMVGKEMHPCIPAFAGREEDGIMAEDHHDDGQRPHDVDGQEPVHYRLQKVFFG